MKKESRTRNSFFNLITGFGVQFLLIIFRFIVRTVFIRTLGTSYLGINGLFSDIMTMLSLTELGFDTAINFKFYKPIAEGDEKRIRVLLKFYKTVYRVIGCVVILIGVCLVPLLPVLIKDYDSLAALNINALLIFFLYLFQAASSYLFFAYRSSIIKAAQKEYILNITSYVVSIAFNIFQIITLMLFKSFVLYTMLFVVSSIVQNFVFAVVSQHYFPQYFIPEKSRISRNEKVDIIKDCGALFVYRINGVVLKATDNLVLSFFAGLDVVGLYSNYLLFFTTAKNVLFRFYSAIKASMGNLFVEADNQKRYDFFQVMNYLSVLMFGTVAVGIAVESNELISAWIGAKYVIRQPLPILIGIELIFEGLKESLGLIRNVTGVFRQMWYRPLIGILINIVMSIVMVQFIGIYGVIIGTISADVFSNFLIDPTIIYKYSLNNQWNVRDYYIQNGKYFLTVIGIFLFCQFLCTHVLVGFGWVSVLLHCVICAVFTPSIFFLIFRRSKECQYILNQCRQFLLK